MNLHLNLKRMAPVALLLLGFAGSASADWPPGSAPPAPSVSVAHPDDAAHALQRSAAVNRSIALDRCARMSGDERLTCNQQALEAARMQSGDADAASVHRANALHRCASMTGDERATCQKQAAHDATLQAGVDGKPAKATK